MPVAERSVRLSRHFYRITVANGIFTLAQSLFSLVVTVLIYETTGSALNVGLAFAISLIPNGIGFLTRVNRNMILVKDVIGIGSVQNHQTQTCCPQLGIEPGP